MNFNNDNCCGAVPAPTCNQEPSFREILAKQHAVLCDANSVARAVLQTLVCDDGEQPQAPRDIDSMMAALMDNADIAASLLHKLERIRMILEG